MVVGAAQTGGPADCRVSRKAAYVIADGFYFERFISLLSAVNGAIHRIGVRHRTDEAAQHRAARHMIGLTLGTRPAADGTVDQHALQVDFYIL